MQGIDWHVPFPGILEVEPRDVKGNGWLDEIALDVAGPDGIGLSVVAILGVEHESLRELSGVHPTGLELEHEPMLRWNLLALRNHHKIKVLGFLLFLIILCFLFTLFGLRLVRRFPIPMKAR